MKNSGVEWIGEIPDEWEVGSVKNYYKLQTGFTPDTKNESYYSDYEVEWLTISDLNGDYFIPSETKSHISQKYINEFKPEIVPKGSLLYSFKLSVGQTAFTNRDIYTNEAIAAFLQTPSCDLRFLYYSSFLIIENSNENIYGAKLLNQKLINNAKIVFPPKSTQQRIASYLDKKCSKIEETIQNQQQVIEKLKAYKQSLITEVVTGKIKIQNGKVCGKYESYKESGVEWIGKIPSEWEIQKLNRFLKTVKGFAFSVNDFENDGLPIVKVSDIKNGKIHLGDSFLSEKRINEFQKVLLHTNDILMTTVGSTPDVVNSAVGQLALVTEDFNNAFLNQNAVKLYSVNNNNIYIYYCLRMKAFREHLNLIAHGTANQASISLKDVLAFSIQIPSKEEQKSIADYLDKKCAAIDNAIDQKQKIIEKLTEYKKSLIYECVTGKKEI